MRLTLRASVHTESRSETLNGREYLVLPIVALIGDIVLSEGTITADGEISDLSLHIAPRVIEDSLIYWSSTPVFANHPPIDVSVTTPEDYEKFSAGLVLNPEFTDNELRLESWIDVELATSKGGKFLSLVTRGQEGTNIEISVGINAIGEEIEGVNASGDKFNFDVALIIPDHLAMLDSSSEGVCSIEDGCGFNPGKEENVTDNVKVDAEDEGKSCDCAETDPSSDPSLSPKKEAISLFSRLRSILGGQAHVAVQATSDRTSHAVVERALRQTLDRDVNVVDIDGNSVIYTSWDFEEFFSQEFSLSEDDLQVTLVGSPKRVVQEVTYLPTKEVIVKPESEREDDAVTVVASDEGSTEPVAVEPDAAQPVAVAAAQVQTTVVLSVEQVAALNDQVELRAKLRSELIEGFGKLSETEQKEFKGMTTCQLKSVEALFSRRTESVAPAFKSYLGKGSGAEGEEEDSGMMHNFGRDRKGA